jgi:hypothetical protein
MGLKRYTGSADNTIVSAYQSNLSTRGTGSNMGMADVLEVFSIWGRQTETSSAALASQELARALIKFPVDTITADRSAGTVPASGSVSFYLKMFNAEHSRTVPEKYSLVVHAVSRSWEEGHGLDLNNYADKTKGDVGSNWMSASKTTAWTHMGGDFLTSSDQWDTAGHPPTYKQNFTSGLEDMEVDITGLVEHWLAGDLDNNGVGVMLSSSYEAYYKNPTDGITLNNTGGALTSYYTKRFFARGTEFFYKRPSLEARWDSTRRDERGEFFYSSSLAPAADNLNTIFLYNYVRGKLRNIPSIGTTGSIMVSLYSGSAKNTVPSGSKLLLHDGKTAVSGGYVSTGVYSASIAITASTTPVPVLYDVWWSGSGADPATGVTELFTGSISPEVLNALVDTREPVYYINITNLRNKYTAQETARFNLYVRNKNWSPTIYSKASADVESLSIVSASYRVVRTLDGYEAISYGTSSNNCTGLSFDISGNYFSLDMDLLQSGYEYALKFAFYEDELDTWNEQNKAFKFRVMNNEY